MSLIQLRLAGFGGQGVIMMGMVIGRAAAIHNDMNATMTQSFGPEARGGSCGAGVLLDSKPILYPYVTQADILVAMSQEAYNKYAPTLNDGGLLLFESELVKTGELPEGARSMGIPATRIAEQLGRKMVANMVMTGFIAAVADIMPEDCVRETVRESVPPGTLHLNLSAFNKGLEYGKNLSL